MILKATAIFVLQILLIHNSSSEETFCGNKCQDPGVVTSRHCFCDKSCFTYKDCCSDSKYQESNSTSRDTKDVICKRGTLVVNSCVKEWNGPEFIIKSCKGSSKSDVDPVGDVPVTSDITGITYSNYFCAICNGDAEKVAVWNIKVSCPLLSSNVPSDKKEAFKYIFYNHPTSEWGYVIRDENTKKMSFHGCALTSEVPEHHQLNTRKCNTKDLRACADGWKADVIKNMCVNGYTDPVYSNGTKYKNFYCAICNRVDQSSLICGEAIGSRTSGQPESDDLNKLSFSLLLDINFSEGNIVGQRLAAVNCLKGEIFDPFARRCRNIVCGVPGYVLHKGMCTSEREIPLL